MSGLNLQAIREALAAQISGYITGDMALSVYPYPVGDTNGRCLVIADRPGGDQIDYFSTMGGNGYAEVYYDLTLICPATQVESVGLALDTYKSAGAGNSASIIDAIHSDRKLGDLVDDCVCLTVDSSDVDAGTCVFHVRILAKKQGAQA